MRGIDHLVLCVSDLEAARTRYAELGFKLTPPAKHPFGTANSLVQLSDHSFLELLAIDDISVIKPPESGHFGFAEFNRQFVEKGPGEGFSMLVLHSADAAGDLADYESAGLQTYAPFDFSRKAKLPDGDEVTVGFSLTFTTHPKMPDGAFFTCQQHAPEHFWKDEFQQHTNTASGMNEVIVLADEPLQFVDFFQDFVGAEDVSAWDEGVSIQSARGNISVISPAEWHKHYPDAFAPDLANGPRLAAYKIAVKDIKAVQECLREAELTRMVYGCGVVVPPDEAFGVAIAFSEN